ncbi:LamG domain-containing protein [Curtobacterium sp. VKM Ac-2922]|uniref:LamG domain-containing protein n=1 Tax=Curtobacterium sp. VKM Ac-2922 TaxID=2929475 RepID=UPI001FB3766F|nr:LamG domain-containing protein [Curtobacterium sp. VKM Ac-2922]MCJ1715124.1 LamG domain-containing protein [Curtobacterium sp. VKM Ac-2922]
MLRRSLPVAALTAIAAIALTLQPLAAHADTAPAMPGSSSTAQPPTAEAAASTKAKTSGDEVVVDGSTTPTSQVVAEPDGTLQLTQTTEPTRVQQDGEWVEIDTDLQQHGDWLEPAAALSPVEFSTGGSDVLARVQTPTGQWVSEAWPDGGALPAPTIDGAAATYGDVLPGVDLRLQASATGMSEVFVVQDAQAAENPDLQSLELSLGGATVHESAASATATAADGSTVTSSKPTWWDSSHEGDENGPGGAAIPQPLPHTADDDTITLDVAQAPTHSATYPLFIDPDWSAGQQHFWFTDRAYPTQSYLDGSPAGYQSVGYAQQDGTTYLSRAFWEFGTSALAGKHIVSAQFGAVATYSCSAVAVEAWRYGPASAGFTWNSDPNLWREKLDTQNFTSTGGCGISPTSVGWNVTSGVSDVAAAKGSTIQIGLRSTNEGGISRKHFNNNARLTVSYNTPPRMPTSLQMTSPQRACSTSASAPAYVNNHAQALVFQLDATDPDTQNVQSMFEIASASNLGASLRTFNTSSGAQGTQSASLKAGTYDSDSPTALAYRAVTTDGTDYGPWSGWCYFTVKNKGPALPQATSTSTSSSTVGKQVSVTISYAASDAVRTVAYWWTPTALTTPAQVPPTTITPASDTDCDFTDGPVTGVCASTSTSTTLTVAPVDSTSTLWVATYDKAGNVSLDSAGHSASVGLEFDNASDDPAVAVGPGHGWNAPANTTGPSTVSDGNTDSPAVLTVGANTSTSVPGGSFNGPPTANAFDFSSGVPLISINRFDGDDHSAVINSGAPSGSHFESNLGDLLSPGQSAAGLTKLYSCATSAGNMTSASSSCEGTGGTATPLGSAWKSAADVPAPLQAVAVYRCKTGSDYFDSRSTTCEGRTVDKLLGYFVKQTVTNTTGPVVDTTKSFTAAAWINPSEDSAEHHAYTALSQNGDSTYAFLIKVDGPRIQGCIHSQIGGSAACATSSFALADGADTNWTYVALQWDAINHQLRLFINGSLATGAASSGVVAYALPSGDSAPTGPFMVGSGMVNGETGDLFAGQVVDPVVVQGIASSTQMTNLRATGHLGGGF